MIVAPVSIHENRHMQYRLIVTVRSVMDTCRVAYEKNPCSEVEVKCGPKFQDSTFGLFGFLL